MSEGLGQVTEPATLSSWSRVPSLGRPEEGRLKGSPAQIEARAGEPGILIGQGLAHGG